jgi:hypothetical protein
VRHGGAGSPAWSSRGDSGRRRGRRRLARDGGGLAA